MIYIENMVRTTVHDELIGAMLSGAPLVKLYNEANSFWDFYGLAERKVILRIRMRSFKDLLSAEVDAFTSQRLQAVQQVQSSFTLSWASIW